jgi:hypothetical protein
MGQNTHSVKCLLVGASVQNLLRLRRGLGHLWGFGLTLVALLAIAGQALAVPINIFDGTFNDSDYTQVDLVRTAGATASASTLTSGGNPGNLREIYLTVGPFDSAISAQIFDVMSITPAIDGAVTSASWSIDARRTANSIPTAPQIAAGIVVQQDGVTRAQALGTNSTTSWQNFSAADIVSLFPDVNWISGGEIKFGFYNSASATSTPFSIAGGYDNFTVVANVDPIPEPSTVLLLAFALIGFASVRLHLVRRSSAGCEAIPRHPRL